MNEKDKNKQPDSADASKEDLQNIVESAKKYSPEERQKLIAELQNLQKEETGLRENETMDQISFGKEETSTQIKKIMSDSDKDQEYVPINKENIKKIFDLLRHESFDNDINTNDLHVTIDDKTWEEARDYVKDLAKKKQQEAHNLIKSPLHDELKNSYILLLKEGIESLDDPAKKRLLAVIFTLMDKSKNLPITFEKELFAPKKKGLFRKKQQPYSILKSDAKHYKGEIIDYDLQAIEGDKYKESMQFQFEQGKEFFRSHTLQHLQALIDAMRSCNKNKDKLTLGQQIEIAKLLEDPKIIEKIKEEKKDFFLWSDSLKALKKDLSPSDYNALKKLD